MNSKTLEMLEKFVGEEENEDELEDIGQKLNTIKEKANQKTLNDNELFQKEDEFSNLIKNINNLDPNYSENDNANNKDNKSQQNCLVNK